MKFKKVLLFIRYSVLYLSWFSPDYVKCDGQNTTTMVSVDISQDEDGNGKFVHACGGTLITTSVIFTGCSCITIKPKGEEKGRVEILSPEKVRVSAGVSEAKKGNARLQTAVAYALSIHDLCDATYVYNYGMIKLTTSFVLENGLELSHVLSLDVSNYDKNIKSMGTKDCWAEVLAAPEPSRIGSTSTSPTKVTNSRGEGTVSIETIDYTEPGGGTSNETTETDYELSGFTGDIPGDISGEYAEDTSEASSGDDDRTDEHASTSSHTEHLVNKTESHVASVANTTSEVKIPNKTTPAVTTAPNKMNHSSNGNVSVSSTTIMPSGNGTGQNGTNSTDINKPHVATNAKGGANGTVKIPPTEHAGNTSSFPGGNTSTPIGASNSSEIGIGRRPRRRGNTEMTATSLNRYKLERKRAVSPPAQVGSHNATVIANNSLVGMNATGVPGNKSEAGRDPSTVNDTAVHGQPNGNVSVTVIPSSNGTRGGNSAGLPLSKDNLNGTANVTSGNNGTEHTTVNGTAIISVANATVTGVTTSISNVSVTTGKANKTRHTERTGEQSGSSSYDSKTTDYVESGSIEIKEGSTTVMNYTLTVKNRTTQAASKTPAESIPAMPATKATKPPKTGRPRSVKRIPVSILDWKECHDLVCPDQTKKCDSSFDVTKWCLTSLKDEFRVCDGDTGAPVYCKSSLMGLLSNVKVACPKKTAKGVAVGVDQAFEYIKSMMEMPDFTKKMPPAETKARKSSAPKEHIPNAMHILIGLLKIVMNDFGW